MRRNREVFGSDDNPDEGLMTWKEVASITGRKRAVIIGKTGEKVSLTGEAKIIRCEQTGDYAVAADATTNAGTVKLTIDQANGLFPDLQPQMQAAIARSRQESPLLSPRRKK